MRLPPFLLVLAACNPDGGLTLHDNNRPPEVTLLAPGANERFVVGVPVEFEALVEDDATLLADLELSWRTTNGGALDGTLSVVDDAVSLLVEGLATGDHTVSLTAVDAQGADGQAAVAIVVEDNLPPTVAFLDPDQGDRYALGDDVLVVASFDDDWDPIADIGLSWADEAAVSGAPTAPDDAGEAHITLSGLALGPHRVTVTASDTFDSTRTVSVDFVVVEPDGDGDGHDSAEFGGDDCDDTLASVHPGADEVCDGDDNDCDSATDEDPVDGDTWYFDNDLDGVGDFGVDEVACAAPTPQWKATGGDCADNDNARFPGNPEVCDNKDNDCAGGVDNGLSFATYYTDVDGDTWGLNGTAVSACAPPVDSATRGGDCNDGNDDVNPGEDEVCNGIDDDCALGADDGLTFTTWYYDGDLDGHGNPSVSQSACEDPGSPWKTVGGDCADNDNARFPGNPEVCDNKDNDCANGVDNGLTFANYYTDGDSDTWGTGSAINACAQPPNTATRGGDCADGDSARFPGNPEVCDGKDNDCANGTDDGLTFLDWYYDFDLDGFGDPDVSQNRCDVPAGRWIDVAGDCDDSDEYVNPDETETCGNGVDDDCANGVDDGCDVDHSGVWKLYIPGTNTVRNVTYGCGGWSFSFDTVVIDAAWPSIEVVAGGSTDVRVNGCEPGFNCDGNGMLGSYTTDTDWSAADSVDPFLGLGYYEYYEWRAESGVAGTKATFIDADTFRASFSWRFQAAPPPFGSPPPAECEDDFLTVEGRRQ